MKYSQQFSRIKKSNKIFTCTLFPLGAFIIRSSSSKTNFFTVRVRNTLTEKDPQKSVPVIAL